MALSLRKKCEQRLDDLKSVRSYYEPMWIELAEYISPKRYIATKHNTKDAKILHSAGTKACDVLSSGLMTGITSPARPWFKLIFKESELNEQAAIRRKLAQDQLDLEKMFRESNVYSALQVGYHDMAIFGTECLLLEKNENFLRGGSDNFVVLKLTHIPVGEYWLACNSVGTVDTLYREITMTVSQIMERWGKSGRLSQQILNADSQNKLDQKFTICHAIEPRRERNLDKSNKQNMLFASYYWEQGTSGDEFLEEGGYEESPILAPRWDVFGGDVYGYPPTLAALPHIKTLQAQEADYLRASELGVKPPIYGPASGGKKLNINPGAINYINNDTQSQGFRPVFEFRTSLGDLVQAKQNTIDQINTLLFSDLFMMISQLDNVRTATEINVRQEEKMLMLGPVVERFQKELLKPLIDRSYGIMHRAEMLSEDPEEIKGREIGIDYISTLAQAQKAVATQGIERVLGFVGNAAAVNPDIVDKINFDQAVDTYSNFVGVPPDIIRSDDEVEGIRQQRAQAQQAAQQQEAMAAMAPMASAAKQGAEAAKILSETDAGMTSSGNLLSSLGLG